MQIQPLQSHILFRLRELRRDSTTPIVLPEDHEQLDPYGEVLAVGPDCKFTAPGDRLILLMSAAVGVPLNGEKLFLVNEGCVIAKYVD